jgi:hypothetical protein
MFDSTKFPTEFYLHLLSDIQEANDELQLSILIIWLLQWKDGKIRESNEGEIKLGERTYSARQTKPNTYAPEKHDHKLCSKDFYNWSKKITALKTFSIEHIAMVKDGFQLWPSGDSLVMPAFLLHILNPRVFPLFDQHVERARRFFSALPYKFSSIDIDTDDYIDYHLFWTELIHEMGINISCADYSEVKRIDDALWSIGKHLKLYTSGEGRDKDIKKRRTYSVQPLLRTQVDEQTTGYDTNSPEFKNCVLAYCTSMTQCDAMKRAANQLKVSLPPSYLAYPGSHIDRWRRQGHPK